MKENKLDDQLLHDLAYTTIGFHEIAALYILWMFRFLYRNKSKYYFIKRGVGLLFVQLLLSFLYMAIISPLQIDYFVIEARTVNYQLL